MCYKKYHYFPNQILKFINSNRLKSVSKKGSSKKLKTVEEVEVYRCERCSKALLQSFLLENTAFDCCDLELVDHYNGYILTIDSMAPREQVFALLGKRIEWGEGFLVVVIRDRVTFDS